MKKKNQIHILPAIKVIRISNFHYISKYFSVRILFVTLLDYLFIGCVGVFKVYRGLQCVRKLLSYLNFLALQFNVLSLLIVFSSRLPIECFSSCDLREKS